ncbi:MAG: hypothetical protein ACOCUW_01400 [Gemmatimonadota bacterium]
MGTRGWSCDARARFLQHLPPDLEFAIAFRDPGWLVPETSAVLEEAGTAPALGSGAWLDGAAARATEIGGSAAWVRGGSMEQVFAFFGNDYQGTVRPAPRSLLGQEPVTHRKLTPQRELFG